MSQAWHDRNFARVQERIKQFGTRPVILRGSSSSVCSDVPNGTLGLLYIDGDHTYDGVMQDLKLWVPKVVLGGVVGLHDYENPAYGVKPALQDYCKERGFTIHTLPENKPEDAGAWFYVE